MVTDDRGASNRFPQAIIGTKIRKILHFLNQKEGYILNRFVSVMIASTFKLFASRHSKLCACRKPVLKKKKAFIPC